MADKDKQISEQLNKLFSKATNQYVPVKGVRNYLKMHLENAVAYCYIDCFAQKNCIQHELVTVVQNLQGPPKVYKNALSFQFSSNINTTHLIQIKVNLTANQNVEMAGLVSFCYSYKEKKQISKHALLMFDIESIKNGEQLFLEELSLQKKILQARWHPYSQNLIITLTEQSFELMRFEEQGIERIKSYKIKDHLANEKSTKILDFCFWKSSHQNKSYNIIAIAQDGTLFVFLLKIEEEQLGYLLPHQNDVAASMKKYDFRLSQILKRPSELIFTAIQAYSPLKGVLFLFKKARASGKDGKLGFIIISALIQLNGSYVQQPLISFQCKLQKGSQLQKGYQLQKGNFQIPYVDLFYGYFYFWHNQELVRANLNLHINYLKELFSNPTQIKMPPNSVDTEIIVEVKQNVIKFVAVDISAIKVLRKSQTAQQYLFKSLTIQTNDLLAEQQSASKRLNQIFANMQKQMENMIQPKKNSYEAIINQSLPLLKQTQNSSDLQAVNKNLQTYVAKATSKLQSQQKELIQLHREADKLASLFASQKSKWRQLQELLSRIQKNSETVWRLESEQMAQNHEGRSIAYITENCRNLQAKPLQLDQELRNEYLENFQQQLTAIQSLKELLSENQRILHNIANSKT